MLKHVIWQHVGSPWLSTTKLLWCFICARCCFTPPSSLRKQVALSPAFLQARKPKHREVKQPPWSHTAKRGHLVIYSSSCWWGRSSCPRVMGMAKHMTPATRQMGQTGVYLSRILPTGGGHCPPCRAHRALRTEWAGEAWGDGLCRSERARWPQVSEGGRAGREQTALLRVNQGPHGKKCCLAGGPFLLERRGRAFVVWPLEALLILSDIKAALNPEP